MAIATVLDLYERGGLPQSFGTFRVVDRLADGGTASVFRGEHPETGELVALKTVRTGVAHEIAVLAREISTLRALNHPGIVRFVEAGTQDGMPWMAVELVEGKTLFDEITSLWQGGGRAAPDAPVAALLSAVLPLQDSTPRDGSWMFSLQADPALALPTVRPAAGHLSDALAMVIRMVPGLDYIHGCGIVHGDLKPPNVLLAEDGKITIVDFGLSYRPRDPGGAFEINGLRMGTTEYAAPEQISGARVGVTADIYSLGCILYELVTGRIPFEGDTPEEIAQKHLDEDPIPPSQLVSGLWPELEELIMTMLAKRPSRRPRKARDVGARLHRMLLRHQQQ